MKISSNLYSTMLISLVAWFVASTVFGITTGGGRGVFRVAVTVYEEGTLRPIQGVTLSMRDAGAKSLEESPNLKHLLPMLLPKKTSEYGDAFVYYYGGFHSVSDPAGDSSYSQQVLGTLVVEKDGFKTVVIELEKFIGAAFESKRTIPLIEVRLKPMNK